MTDLPIRPLPLLDERLSCIRDEVLRCALAADIGADHCKLSLSLLSTGRCERIIVSDTSPHSRDKARVLFASHRLMERVSIRGEDGLNALHGKPEAVVIAGMGGRTIARILSQNVPLQGARLIISANQEIPMAREAVVNRGYRILREMVVKANGHFHLVMSAVPGAQTLSEPQRMLGVCLTGTPSAQVMDYLLWQLSIARDWRTPEGIRHKALMREYLNDQERNGSDSLRVAGRNRPLCRPGCL